MREQIQIATLTGNRITVTYRGGRPSTVSWDRPLSARDELELLCRRDALAQFVLRRYYRRAA